MSGETQVQLRVHGLEGEPRARDSQRPQRGQEAGRWPPATDSFHRSCRKLPEAVFRGLMGVRHIRCSHKTRVQGIWRGEAAESEKRQEPKGRGDVMRPGIAGGACLTQPSSECPFCPEGNRKAFCRCRVLEHTHLIEKLVTKQSAQPAGAMERSLYTGHSSTQASRGPPAAPLLVTHSHLH